MGRLLHGLTGQQRFLYLFATFPRYAVRSRGQQLAPDAPAKADAQHDVGPTLNSYEAMMVAARRHGVTSTSSVTSRLLHAGRQDVAKRARSLSRIRGAHALSDGSLADDVADALTLADENEVGWLQQPLVGSSTDPACRKPQG